MLMTFKVTKMDIIAGKAPFMLITMVQIPASDLTMDIIIK